MQYFDFRKPDSSPFLSECKRDNRAKKNAPPGDRRKKNDYLQKKMKSVSDSTFNFRLNK
jgi:hypothetical protein